MKNHLFKTIAAALLLALLPVSGSAKTLYSFLDPVRTEITNQLFMVTNTIPVNTKQATLLKAALKQIDRPTATNLTIDVQTLNVLVSSLSRASASNTFLPLLDTAADNYFDVLVTGYSDLTNRIVAALPSGVKKAATNNLAQLLAKLQLASNTNLTAAVRLMSQSVAKLKVTTTLVTRAVAVPPGPNTVNAKIGASVFAVRGLLGPGHPSGARGDYVDGTHILGITANKLVGASLKVLAIQVSSVTEGETVHTFGDSAIASLAVAGLSGSGASVSGNSGTITVNMNSSKRVMSGSFSFNVTGTAGNVPITGTFMVNY